MKELVIEKQILAKNFAIVRQKAGAARIMAVLKSNAYGLGLSQMAAFYSEMGVTAFGVTDIADAARLRETGYTSVEIHLLRSTAIPSEIEQILDLGVIAAVGSQEAALALSGIAEKRSAIAEANIVIDTGLGRYGFLPSETDKIRAVYRYMSSLAVAGIYTHMPRGISVKEQESCAEKFNSVIEGLRSASLETGTIHAFGSTVLFSYKNPPVYDMVRIGAAISGRIPGKHELKKTGCIRTQIADIRWISEGNKIGRSFKVKNPVRTGIVPVGYADGYLAERPAQGFGARFSNVMKNPKPAVRLESGESLRVLGEAGQNHIMVDLTKLPGAVGDCVYIEVNPLYCPEPIPRVFI